MIRQIRIKLRQKADSAGIAGILEQSVRARDPAGNGLSYWPVRLNRLAGRYYNSIPFESLSLTHCFKIPAM
jgi:hypothetical protein